MPESEVEQMEQRARAMEVFNYSLEVVKVEIQPSQMGEVELKNCPICYNNMQPRDEGPRVWPVEVKLAQCGHAFCE